MTDYDNSSRRQVRPVRWRCPGCGAMGDTTVITNRRCTIVRKWCDQAWCREGYDVRRALQRKAPKAFKPNIVMGLPPLTPAYNDETLDWGPPGWRIRARLKGKP